MAFTDIIDVNKPLGTYRVSTIDDYERETRRHLRDCMMEISGYPYSTALKVSTWTTATRPESPVDGMFGFNTDTGEMEYYDNGQWKLLTQALPDVYDKARKDQNGNVINTTYATKTELSNATAVMTGATANAAGYKGLVPTPAAGKQTSFLRGDGTWASLEYPTGTLEQLSAGTDNTGKLWSARTLAAFISGDDTSANSDNGYIEFPNGFMIQWGTITSQEGEHQSENGNSVYKTISFPTSFKSKVYWIGISAGFQSYGNHGYNTITNPTRTNFRVYPYLVWHGLDNNDWANTYYGGKWIAFGY